MSDNKTRFPPDPEIKFKIDCDDLEYALNGFIEKQGYRLFSVFPADEPRQAIVEREGSFVLLEKQNGKIADSRPADAIVVTGPEDTEWHEGRAGMSYRDLIPGRAEGRLVASHIRIAKGGPVPDYVHFHKVTFQVIYCLKGSCKLVYEAQGEPFRFKAGDCVLQPPGIRHRVLECSDGFEVLELSSPAEHATYADHEMELPGSGVEPEEEFGGQRFHRHVPNYDEGPRADLGLEGPSSGAINGELATSNGSGRLTIETDGSASSFLYVLEGGVEATGGASGPLVLPEGSACYIPAGPDIAIECAEAGVLVFQFSI